VNIMRMCDGAAANAAVRVRVTECLRVDVYPCCNGDGDAPEPLRHWAISGAQRCSLGRTTRRTRQPAASIRAGAPTEASLRRWWDAVRGAVFGTTSWTWGAVVYCTGTALCLSDPAA
jgi:hypothetical protein